MHLVNEKAEPSAVEAGRQRDEVHLDSGVRPLSYELHLNSWVLLLAREQHSFHVASTIVSAIDMIPAICALGEMAFAAAVSEMRTLQPLIGLSHSHHVPIADYLRQDKKRKQASLNESKSATQFSCNS